MNKLCDVVLQVTIAQPIGIQNSTVDDGTGREPLQVVSKDLRLYRNYGRDGFIVLGEKVRVRCVLARVTEAVDKLPRVKNVSIRNARRELIPRFGWNRRSDQQGHASQLSSESFSADAGISTTVRELTQENGQKHHFLFRRRIHNDKGTKTCLDNHLCGMSRMGLTQNAAKVLDRLASMRRAQKFHRAAFF
jgi:hypothetical protein